MVLVKKSFLARWESFYLSKSESNNPVSPKNKHEFGMYMNKQWFILRAKDGSFDERIL